MSLVQKGRLTGLNLPPGGALLQPSSRDEGRACRRCSRTRCKVGVGAFGRAGDAHVLGALCRV